MLLLEGARLGGSMEEGFFYVEERIYLGESRELLDFCQWVDKNIGGCSEGNIDMLFKAFKNPTDKKAQKLAEDLRDRIKEINNLMKR